MTERIVIKIGSSSLTSDEGGLNRGRIGYFADELAALRKQGYEVLLVTSGAVAAGFKQIGYESRPKLLHEKQAAAAVGQALLMQAYQEAIAVHHHVTGVAQILLTRPDFSNRRQIQNAKMTIEELLHQGIIPIINENDTVSTDELKFGDNDTLSALVSNLVKAKQLIILTDTDGLYTEDPRKNPFATHIARVEQISDDIMKLAGGAGSSVGTGGMRSKIEAAHIAMRGGVIAFVGRATEPGDILLAVAGSGRGTYFDTHANNLTIKKQWIGFHSEPKGYIVVDGGAEDALLNGGKSLLPAGITAIEGDFHSGDVVEVINAARHTLGRGIVNYDAVQIQAAAGLSTDEVKRRVEVSRIEVIHRDEWVTLKS